MNRRFISPLVAIHLFLAPISAHASNVEIREDRFTGDASCTGVALPATSPTGSFQVAPNIMAHVGARYDKISGEYSNPQIYIELLDPTQTFQLEDGYVDLLIDDEYFKGDYHVSFTEGPESRYAFTLSAEAESPLKVAETLEFRIVSLTTGDEIEGKANLTANINAAIIGCAGLEWP